MTGTLDRIEECPVCFATDWEIDYMRTDDGEMRVDTCGVCGWPPPSPHGVKEWRDKWAIAGETPHSHPSPATLRHAAYLADKVEALVEVAKAAQETRDWFVTVAAEEDNPVFGIYERLDAALARLEDNQ